MSAVTIPLYAAFVGALFGAFTSIFVMIIQSRAQAKRERLKMASDIALADYKQRIEFYQDKPGDFTIPPIVVYLHYHMKMLELIDKGNVTPETVKALQEESSKISASIVASQKR